MEVEKKVLNTIKRYQLLKPHQHIILGLSGGPDSVCLFHVLLSAAQETGWMIHPVHINHKFRPGAAEEDQAYAERISQEAGCLCRTFTYDCRAIAEKEKMTSEEAGRKVRYEAFEKVAEELRLKGVLPEDICIAVAHNADDQAETILFRLLRGTGVDGLSGIKYRRTDEKGNQIIRPLLDVKKAEILEYCSHYGLNPKLDQTNNRRIYTRNRLRLELIPYLEKEYNPSIKDTLIRMGKSADTDSEFLWEQAKEVYDKLVLFHEEKEILLDGEGLRACHKAIRRRILSKAFGKLGLAEDLTWAHFESCETIVFHREPSAVCHLPRGFYLARVYENIKAGRHPAGCEEGGAAELPQIRITLYSAEEYRQRQKADRLTAAFDYDLLEKAFGENFKERLLLGFRTAGDFIPVGENKTKKIQDYFVDRKIPRQLRDTVPLLKIGREVLWILQPGGKGRFTSKYKLCKDTKKVICIEIIC